VFHERISKHKTTKICLAYTCHAYLTTFIIIIVSVKKFSIMRVESESECCNTVLQRVDARVSPAHPAPHGVGALIGSRLVSTERDGSGSLGMHEIKVIL